MMRFIVLGTALLAVLGTSLPAAAQGNGAGSISGVVKDASGGVLPGVTVEASSPALIERVRTVVTDAEGKYQIIELSSGTYTVKFSLEGFSSSQRDNVEIRPNFNATINTDLKVGSLEETINVTGQSPLVDVQNVTKQQTISNDLLDTVPTSKGQLAYISLIASAITPPGAQDVGGSKGETSIRMSIHGARQNDAKALQDGMSYNWINVPTGRSFFTNPLAAQEVVVETGSGGNGEYSSGGAQVNLIPTSGGNNVSGTIFAAGTNHSLQSDNLSDQLIQQGLKTANGIRSIYDLNAVIGGPIVRDRLWFSTAHRRWGRDERIANMFHDSNLADWVFTPNLDAPLDAAEDSRSDNLRLTWQATSKHRLTMSYEWQHNNALNQAGGLNTGTLAPEAIGNPDAYCNRVGLTQGTWLYPKSSHVLFEAGASLMTQYRSFGFEYGCGGDPYSILVRDTATGISYHGTGVQRNDRQYPLVERASMSYVSGSHHVKVGMNGMESVKYHTYTGNGSPTLPAAFTFSNGNPTSLTEYASPLINDLGVRPNIGLFGQDQWRIHRVTLSYGLRYEYLRAYASAVDIPAGLLVGARSYPQADCLPCWHDLMPRLGVAWDMFGDGRTALKGSIGKYVGTVNGGLAATYSPAQATVANTTRAWSDANGNFYPDCNLTNPAANSECGAMANSSFGQQQLRNTPDPNWITGFGNREDSWQTSVSVDRQVSQGVAVNVGYYRTWYGNFTVADNTLVTPADYDPYCITAPTDSRLPGDVSGQQICGLYDINPAKFGQVNSVQTLANNFGKQTEIYNGADANFTVRLPGKAMLSGGWNIGNSLSAGNAINGTTASKTNSCFVVDSPQQLYHCESGNPYQQRVKVNGSYPLPQNFTVAAVFQSLPGANYGATFTIPNAQIAPSLGRNLAGGVRNVTIDLLTPNSAFLANRVTQLDVRLSHSHKVGGGKMQLNFDVYNVLNGNAVLGVNNTYGASWLVPTQILDARLMKFSVQYDF